MSADLNFELRDFVPPTVRMPVRAYDPNKDDVRSLLADVCDALEGHVRFHASGLDEDDWPVDVRTDLLVFVEQLPSALDALRSESNFEIDFYEQGFIRFIHFERADGGYRATRTDFEGEIFSSAISVAALEEVLQKFLARFVEIVSIVAPHVARHPWFVVWHSRDGSPTLGR